MTIENSYLKWCAWTCTFNVTTLIWKDIYEIIFQSLPFHCRLQDQVRTSEENIARLEEKITLCEEEKDSLQSQIQSKDADLGR